MADFVAFLTDSNLQTPNYPRYIFWVAVIAVVFATQLIKVPIKTLIEKKVSSERAKNWLSLIYMVIPFGFGMLASWVLTFCGYPFSWESGVVWGSMSQPVYTLISKVVKKFKKNGTINLEEVKADVQEMVTETKQGVTEVMSIVDKYKSQIGSVGTTDTQNKIGDK